MKNDKNLSYEEKISKIDDFIFEKALSNGETDEAKLLDGALFNQFKILKNMEDEEKITELYDYITYNTDEAMNELNLVEKISNLTGDTEEVDFVKEQYDRLLDEEVTDNISEADELDEELYDSEELEEENTDEELDIEVEPVTERKHGKIRGFFRKLFNNSEEELEEDEELYDSEELEDEELEEENTNEELDIEVEPVTKRKHGKIREFFRKLFKHDKKEQKENTKESEISNILSKMRAEAEEDIDELDEELEEEIALDEDDVLEEESEIIKKPITQEKQEDKKVTSFEKLNEKYTLVKNEIFDELDEYEKMFIEDAKAEGLEPGDPEFDQMLNERVVNRTKIYKYLLKLEKINLLNAYENLGEYERMFVDDATAEGLTIDDMEFNQMLNERCVNKKQIKEYYDILVKSDNNQTKIVNDYKKHLVYNSSIDLSNKKIDELKVIAKNNEISNFSKLNKKQLIDILNQLNEMKLQEADKQLDLTK